MSRFRTASGSDRIIFHLSFVIGHLKKVHLSLRERVNLLLACLATISMAKW